MSSKYYATEQYRIVTEVTEYLSTHEYFGIAEYIELTQIIGSGMVTRLRMTPDNDLKSRLSHLYAVCKCASMEEPIFDDQILVSIEGQNPMFNFDCDLILESKGVTYLIDFTATSNPSILADKERILNSKINDPSIASRVVETIVYRFEPHRFHVNVEKLCRDVNMKTPETYTLSILELMASKSFKTNDKFLDNCHKVREHAEYKIRNTEYRHKNYSSTKLNDSKVNLAVLSASSNVVSDTCNLFLNVQKRQYDPFTDALKLLSAQFHDLKQPFIHRQADLTPRDRTLVEILTRLSDDPLCKVLSVAATCTGKIAGLNKNGKVDIIDSFPTSSSNKKMLRSDCDISIAAMQVKGHYFKILFSFDAMDDQLRRTICNFTKPTTIVPEGTKASIEECLDKVKNAERELHRVTKILNKRLSHKAHSTIFSKIVSLCVKSKEDTGNVGILANNLLSSISNVMDQITCGSLISHFYEITKSFAFSIKNSHKDETYYIGINGAYDSITITKMSATQDSFDRLHYSVVSKFSGDSEYESICWKKHDKNKNVSRSHFRTMDNNEVSYNLRLPYYIISLLTWDIESSLDKGRFSTSDLPEKIANSTLHSIVNRDTFSQAAQQVRYLYMSSIGFGADASKIIDKITFLKPRYTWEFVYITRMIKLGFSLSILRDNDSLSRISQDGNLQVVFPHTSKVAQSFNQVVSSMYYCNIFNKFRAFHEVSEAYCFNELDQEMEIYKQHKETHPDNLAGFSYKTMISHDNISYLTSDEFVKNECDLVDILLESGPGRFRASCAVVISCSNKYLPHNDNHISHIYKELGRSPIEACTLRGSMSSGKATDQNQGCRAASAILEELFRVYDQDPEKLNKNAWLHTVFMDKIEKSGGDSSIFSFVVNQLADDTIEYIYRIVQKDQIGNREISVLNAVFRLGALFVETISRSLSDLIKNVDLLENKDKDYEFETAVKHSIDSSKKNDDIICFDNSDQKRWGPNHMLNVFSAMFYGVLHKERGLLRMIYFIADKVLQKQAKFPESLIKLFTKFNETKSEHTRMTREGLNEDHGSETLKAFFRTHANDLYSNKFSAMFPYGMCQGIFHATSSVYHAIMCRFIEDICSDVFGKAVSVKSFCTSDDSSRIIKISRSKHRIPVIKQIHAIIILSGVLFNIMRNDAKSSFSFYIAEFNSIFFKNGIMATPSIKQRISKIDAGSGSNHVEDYLTALSSSANYFTVGGSYVGACILSLLNITLHTEQWSRWDRLNDNRYFMPVELDGFPVIEPISTCLSGAMSNLYLRSAHLVSSKEYAMIFSSIVSEKPEEFKLNDYYRIPKSISDDSDNIKIFKNSGALGLHSLIRTDKKLSQFEKRHAMSQWKFPDHFLTLRKQSSDSRFFLYNIYKNGCMSLFQDSLGVNSFYKRFTDPWVSSDRKCVRISKNSILTNCGLETDQRYSYSEITSKLKEISFDNARSKLREMSKNSVESQFTVNLIDQLIPRLDDSKTILDFLLSQECSEYLDPKDTPATSRVTLRNHEALDQEKYTADLIKVLSGEKSRILLTEYYNDHRKFDTLPTASDCPNMDLKDAILVAENSIFAFNKYIKRNTKMITSGKPTTLSDLVTRVLRSRFFEGLGIRISGSISLIGDRNHAFSYTSWYKTLNDKSRDFTSTHINNSCKRLYSDVVKYGIISESRILSHKDQFEVSEVPTTKKHMKLNSKSRSALITFCKTWVSADLDYSFSYDSLISLFRGNLLSRQGMRVSEHKFVRNCQGLYFDITANGLPVIHLLETDTKDDKNTYKHIFLTESSASGVKIDYELTELGKSKEWARSFELFLPKESVVYQNRSMRVPKSQDSIFFSSVDSATVFDMNLQPYSTTIAISTKDYVIPICHTDTKTVDSINLGYKLKHADFINPVEIYSNILDITNEFKVISPIISKCLNHILYKTSSWSKLENINRSLRFLNFGYSFNNVNEVDIFKSLLLCDNYANINVSSNKLYAYVNNLFKSPDYREGYIMSLSDDDALALRLGDIMEHDDNKFDDVDLEQEPADVDDNSDGDASDFDDSDIDIINDDFDDIDFEGFGEDDEIDPNEKAFQFLDVSYAGSDPEEKTFQSSRTGITINPNSEFPYGIMRYLQKWRSSNTLRRIRGVTEEDSTVLDLPSAYLTSYRLTGTIQQSLLHRLSGFNEISLPCPLSDLITIQKVVG